MVDLPAADAALEKARALADPTWPPVRTICLVYAESFVASIRGDMPAALGASRRRVALARTTGASDASERGNLIDVELAAGQATQAVATGLALISSLNGGRDERGLFVARINLSAALLALDDREQARPHLRSGWAQAPLFDGQPFFADYLALYAVLDGRFDDAARVAGYAEDRNARYGQRQGNEAAAHARAVQQARVNLGDDVFERLYAEGAALDDSDIEALAFREG